MAVSNLEYFLGLRPEASIKANVSKKVINWKNFIDLGNSSWCWKLYNKIDKLVAKQKKKQDVN